MILVTGGAGYIGSHCILELLKQNEKVIIFDNLSTGSIETVKILENIAKKGQLIFVKGDLKSIEDVKSLFNTYKIDSVIHLAALSLVEESVRESYKYFQNNVSGLINLLDCMVEKGVKYIINSSSASVYGAYENDPIKETFDTDPINPYGHTKCLSEMILKDYDEKYGLKYVSLRYFNVIGANPDGVIGENHNPETHLIPKLLKAISKNMGNFCIYGGDYGTKDGTCIRDYVDVNDLVSAHLLALNYLKNKEKSDVFNVGTQKGYTVQEILSVCKNVTEKDISYKISDRRLGDAAILCADVSKIKKILNWKPHYTLEQSIRCAWQWECKNGNR